MNQPENPSANSQELQKMMVVANLQRRMKSGASNFYWIAGLSVVNSLMTLFGSGFYFVIGLGITLLIDNLVFGISGELGGSPLVLGLGFLFSLVFDAIFAIFGYFASKGQRWAFVVGMVLYALDGLLMLAFKDWIGFAFHLFFLLGVWNGLQALRKLNALRPQSVDNVAFPADIGNP
jgi:hypothetical protein